MRAPRGGGGPGAGLPAAQYPHMADDLLAQRAQRGGQCRVHLCRAVVAGQQVFAVACRAAAQPPRSLGTRAVGVLRGLPARAGREERHSERRSGGAQHAGQQRALRRGRAAVGDGISDMCTPWMWANGRPDGLRPRPGP